jgi:hypothetical protein
MSEGASLRWQRPGTCSGESACVEVAFAGEEVLVRSSEAPEGPVTRFSRVEWADFLTAVKNNEFDA